MVTEVSSQRIRSHPCWPRAFPWIVVGLGAIYLLQAATPLRLDGDTVVFLRASARMADGLPSGLTAFPLGYMAFVSGLDRAGLGMSFVLVLVNCLFTALGIASAAAIFQNRSDDRRSWIVPLTLLAFPVIRYLPMALPEMMFFGVSLVAIAVLNSASSRERGVDRLGLLFVGLALTVWAIMVKLIGFALVPALLYACVLSVRRGRAEGTRLTALQWVLLCASVVVVAVIAVSLDESFARYWSEFKLRYLTIETERLIRGRGWRTVQLFGMVGLNIPYSRFTNISASPNFQPVFFLVGLVGAFVTIKSFRLSLPRSPVGIYVASFLCVLVLWPYNAQRLWLGLVPLLIGYAESTPLKFTPGWRWRALKLACLAWFVATGLAALAYSTRITLSGANFPNVYGLAGGMSAPNRITGRIDYRHNAGAREMMVRYGNPF